MSIKEIRQDMYSKAAAILPCSCWPSYFSCLIRKQFSQKITFWG